MSTSGYHRRKIGDHVLHAETQMMSYGFDPFLTEGSVKPPVFLTSTFAFRSAEDGARFFDLVSGRVPLAAGESPGLVYSRFNNPNMEIVEDRLALLDGAEAALVTSSGMSAISAVLLTFLRPGDQVVQSAPLYGGTETLVSKVLAEWGIGTQVIEDGLSASSMAAALEAAARRGPVRLAYVETPANPTNALIDLRALAREVEAFAGRHGQRPVSVCDNTMLGPIFQQPAAHGIDLSVYSLTKYVGGHSDLVAGGVTGPRTLVDRLRATRGAFGSQLDPHSSWMLARSMETVVLRMRAAAQSAGAVARWLMGNPYRRVIVLHPETIPDASYRTVYGRQCTGAGSTFSFVLEGGRSDAFRVINALSLFKSAVSLGGTESLICHPASTTHSGVPAVAREAAGITEGLIRVSIGLEHADDLIADLDQAFRSLDGTMVPSVRRARTLPPGSPMQRRKLGTTGFDVTPLAFGGNVLGWTADEATSFRLLDAFVAAGGNLIDTADSYSRWVPGHSGGESEAIIGRWIARRGHHGDIVIATKVGSDMGEGHKNLRRDYIVRRVEDSLRRLQIDAIDLYQAHWDDDTTPLEETLEGFGQLVRQGKVKAVGASNLTAPRLAAALAASSAAGLPRYATLQPHYNLYERASFEGPLQDLCVREQIGVISYYSLAAGFLTGKYRGDADLGKSTRGGGMKKYLNPRGHAILASLDTWAARLAATPAQIALAWLMTRPAVVAPIASATTVGQLEEIMRALTLELPAEALQALDAASA